MKKFHSITKPVRPLFATLVATVLIGGTALVVGADEPKANSPAATNSVTASAPTAETVKTAIRKKLTGAELYSMHCNRCHPERYPTEKTAAQWKTVMLHMQVRANLPGNQSRLILQYLQENSGR